jgi:hypothetical protein
MNEKEKDQIIEEQAKLKEDINKQNDSGNQKLIEEINKYKEEIKKLNTQILSMKKLSLSRKSHSKENIKLKEDKSKQSIKSNVTIKTEENEKDNKDSKNNRLINELNLRINNLLKENKEKEEMIKKLNVQKETENKNLREDIKTKNNSIKQLNEKIKVLSKKQIIEHRTIVDDEEFNSLVDENEDLKKVNKDLVEKLNLLNKQRKNATNYYQNEYIINQQKDEINNLNKKYNQLY